MNISYYSIKANLNPAVGYGYAGQHIVKSLNELGHNVKYADPKSDFQINFTQPDGYKLHRDQYQIGYTPWESTKMRDGWVEKLNLCDEVWTTSDWCAEVFKNNGITKPIFVYPHGIEKIWSPKKREKSKDGTIRFLHVGEPANRKAGQEVVDTFAKLFGNNPRYSLTLKCHKENTTRIYDYNGSIVGLPHEVYKNISLVTDELAINELVSLFHCHDVLIYPSYGEGFGFIPLQALATGMPTICTSEWAHYRKFLGPLGLKSKPIVSPWPFEHPGEVLKPDLAHLEELMYDVSINFKAYAGYYYSQAKQVHKEYDWLQLTKNVLKHLEEKF